MRFSRPNHLAGVQPDPLHPHALHALPPHGLRIQLGFAYSDGFGRQIQSKIQAEPGPLAEGGTAVVPRWVGSGWTILDNKGRPVREYEPFFSAGHGFEFEVLAGVSPVLFRDPAGRVVAVLRPDHAYEKVRFGAWRQVRHDANDTCAARAGQTGDPRTDLDNAYKPGFFLQAEAVLKAMRKEPSAAVSLAESLSTMRMINRMFGI